MKLFRILVFIFLVFSSVLSFGQEHESEHSTTKKHPIHRVAAMLGHTYIPVGYLPNIENGYLTVPTWGLSYDLVVIPHWTLGIHSEMETATYVVEHNKGPEIERERPVIVVLAIGFNPWKKLLFEAGFGREFEKSRDFWVYRLGAGYEIEIGEHWDLAPALFIDFKEDLYSSWTFGLQVGRKF